MFSGKSASHLELRESDPEVDNEVPRFSYESPPTSCCSVGRVMSVPPRMGLWLLTLRVEDGLASSSSEVSALLSLVSLGEETEDVLRLLLAGAYL